MIVSCTGIAIIKHKDNEEVYEIDSDELDWDIVSSDDRQMGAEIGYEAVVEHAELGSLVWQLYEYPTGVENYRNTNVNGHILIEDFDYALIHEPEYTEDDEFNMQVEEIVAWFSEHYEDPAERTPYISAEGGYQWIWGGPYDAREVISNNFNEYNDKVIDWAVNIVEEGGIYDWASTPNPDDYEDFEESPSSEQLNETLIKRVNELQALIEPIIKANPGIGHNNPPEEISDNEIPYKDFEELSRISDEIKSVVVHETSTSVGFPKKVSKFQEIGSKVLNWLGARTNALVDGAIKSIAFAWITTHSQQIQDAIKSIIDILSQISG